MKCTGTQTSTKSRVIARIATLVAILSVSCEKGPKKNTIAPSTRATQACVSDTGRCVSAVVEAAPAQTVLGRGNSLSITPQPTISPSDPQPPSANSGCNHERLFGFFPDLEGWARGTPSGMSVPGVGGVMARCEYRHHTNDQVIIAKIVIGTRAEAMLRTAEAAKRARPDSRIVQSQPVQGIDAILYQDTVIEGQWVLTSLLHVANKAVLNISFKNVPPEQCLQLARRFDWTAMAAAVRTITLPTLQVPRYDWGPNEWGANP